MSRVEDGALDRQAEGHGCMLRRETVVVVEAVVVVEVDVVGSLSAVTANTALSAYLLLVKQRTKPNYSNETK